MTADVTAATFENEVLKSDKPVLVDFWAPWCGPCRSMAPVVEELEKDRAGTLKVVKLNVDDNKSVSDTYGVRGIPAFLMFRDGKVIGSTVGAQPKAKFYQWADDTMALPPSAGQTAEETKAAAATNDKGEEEKIKKLVVSLMKGKLGKGLLGFSMLNNALTIAGGLIVAAAAPVAAALAVTAGLYRGYNALKGHADMMKDPEGAIEKAQNAQKNAGFGEKVLKAGLNLAFGIGVLVTGVVLLGTIGHAGFLAGAGALLLGGKMALGGGLSTLFHGASLAKTTLTGGGAAEAKEASKPAPAPQAPAPQQPTAAPVVTTQPVTQLFDAAASPAAAEKAPEATPAVKAPEAKPPAPPQA